MHDTGVRLSFFLGLMALGAWPASGARAEEAHPGIGVESMYSEAVLAYNRKQSDEAVSILDRLLQGQPNHVEALELKALALKEKGKDAQSLDVYRKLLELKPPHERGPYHFQVGVIFNDEKKPELARPHFEQAVLLKFNEVPSHLFLGLISFNAGDFFAAQGHFEQVSKHGSTELKVVARYYLGMVNFKSGFAAGGTSELIAARKLSVEVPESKMARDIRGAAEKILEPFNQGQWFANLAVLTGYDSNIAQISTQGQASSTASSGMSTPKMTFSGGIGHMDSPLQTMQLVGSLRSSFNRNFNSLTHSYEYASATGSVYLNFTPLQTWSWGLKFEGTSTFQNQLQDGSTDRYLYAPYNFSGETGAFFRNNWDRYNQYQLDLYLRPAKYVSDDSQTGHSLYARGSWRHDTGSKAWNPGSYLSVEKSTTTSLDYGYQSVGAGVYDVLRPGTRDTINLSLDIYQRNYPQASLARTDRNFVLRTNLVHALMGRYSILGDLSYTKNISTIEESYSYNEWNFSVGVSWTL